MNFKVREKCEKKIWKSITLFTRDAATNNDSMEIVIMMPSNETEVIEELRLYTITNFVADFGGYLGLLLGASVVSFVDLLVDTLQKYYRKNH